MNQANQTKVNENARETFMDKLLDDFGWGALLITVGTLWLMPITLVPQGTGMITVGLIMPGLSAARYSQRFEVNVFGLALGVLALFAGVGSLLNVHLPLFSIALIVVGACMLLAPHLNKRTISPNTPHWHC